MSYTTTAAMMFDSAAASVRHTGVASSIVSALSYVDIEEHSAKIAECDSLLTSLQAEADRRAPTAATGGLVGKLATAAADHKATVTAVARYFATAAGHAYRRAVKSAMQRAANTIAAGAATAPETEPDAIQFVAEYVDPVTVPFIGVKRGRFIVEWESLRGRFVRLSEARHKRAQAAGEPLRQLAELRAALDAAGIELDTAAAA